MTKARLYALALASIMTISSGAASYAQTVPDTYRTLDAGQYGLLVKLPIKPEQRTAFLTLMKARIAASRLRPEIVDFRVLSTPDPNVFVAFESFRDKEAFGLFEKLPESQSFLAGLMPLLGGNVEATTLAPLP